MGVVLVVGEGPKLDNLQVIPLKEVESRSATVYGYSSSIDETDDSPFTMASGQTVREGVVANNCLKFGTRIVLDGRILEIQDRMHKRYGCNVYDVWFPSKKQALNYGKRTTEIYILDDKQLSLQNGSMPVL